MLATTNINKKQLNFFLVIGTIGLLIFGIQPLLISSLVNESIINHKMAGIIASVEICAIAIGSTLGVISLRKLNTKYIALCSILGLTILNLFSSQIHNAHSLVIIRLVAGLTSGIMVAITATAIAKAFKPALANATFTFMQCLAQCIFLILISGVNPNTDNILFLLASFCLAPIVILKNIPSLKPIQQHSNHNKDTTKNSPPIEVILALVSATFFVGAAICLWVYLGVILSTNGYTQPDIAMMLSISLGAQTAGAFSSQYLSKTGETKVILTIGILALVVIEGCLIQWINYGWAAILCVSTFGFIWMLTIPTFTRFLCEIEPSRKTLAFMATAQLTGAAAFPVLTSLITNEESIKEPVIISITAFIVSLLLIYLSANINFIKNSKA